MSVTRRVLTGRRVRLHAVAVGLSAALVLAALVAGAGGQLAGTGTAHAGSRLVASPAVCGPRQGVCPAQVVLGAGAWCWFADPRAVHIDRDGLDEVVVGWLSPTGQVIVETIDRHGHATQAVVSHTYADDHNAPALSVEPDNRITVYWSTHNGHHLYYQTTRRPGDVSSWEHWSDLTSNTPGGWGFTYPNPVILPAERNRHYLFWRGGDWEPSFATRTDTGRWGPAHVVVDVPGRRPYMKVASNGSNRIALAFTDGHPDNDVTSIYFAEVHAGGVYSAAGRWLGALGGAPVIPGADTLVYDAGANHDVRSWLQDVAFDRAGHPVVLYSLYPPGTSAQYWYARWDGHRWLRHLITAAGPSIDRSQPHYLGGAVLDHTHPGIVYVSAMAGTHHQLERWVTGDGGHSWTFTQLTTADQAEVRPVVAQELPGASAPASTVFVLRGNYNDYWHYHTSVTMLSSHFAIAEPLTRIGGESAATATATDPDGPSGGD